MESTNILRPTIFASIQAAMAQLSALGRTARNDSDCLQIYKFTDSISAAFVAKVEASVETKVEAALPKPKRKK
jgi:hypothetical protein